MNGNLKRKHLLNVNDKTVLRKIVAGCENKKRSQTTNQEENISYE